MCITKLEKSYDSEDIKMNLLLDCYNSDYPTIDHKISMWYGFENDISPEIIGGIDNLCITKSKINRNKSYKNADEYIKELQSK